MLTIKSNLKIKDLDTLSKILIKDDIINFALSKVGGGFTPAITDKVAAKLKYKSTTLIINDISLQQTDKFLELGYKLNEITLAFGKWNKDGTVSNDRTVYNIMKAIIENNIEEKLNIVFLGDIFMGIKHWNSVIANVPYGKIGANITYNIREKVSYDEFANLLPANDYKRNKTKDLFNYQSEMEPINDGFADAAVTTHLALIHKNKVNSMTLDEFERSQYIDKSLNKYFAENIKRTHYAIDNAVYKPKLNTFKQDFDLRRCLFIGKRYISDEHLPYTKEAAGYKVNIERIITHDELINISAKSEQANGNVGDFILAQFNTTIEQNNITNFLYSKNGFRFIAKVLVAMNADSYCHIKKFIPKVDWTRSWTVEEILADYGYTKEEIQEVMNDLVNFKGMED